MGGKFRVGSFASRGEIVHLRHELSQSHVEGAHNQTLHNTSRAGATEKSIRNSAVATRAGFFDCSLSQLGNWDTKIARRSQFFFFKRKLRNSLG